MIGSLATWAQQVPFTGVFSEIQLPGRYVGAVAGFWNGDTAVDLLVVTEDRRMLCYPGSKDGRFGAPVAINVAEALPPVRVQGFSPGPTVAVGNEVYAATTQIFAGTTQCGFAPRGTLPFRVSGSGNFGGGLNTDVIGATPGTNTIQSAVGRFGGSYDTVRTLPVSGASPRSVKVDGDRFTDMVVGLGTGSQVWLADTKGRFTPGQTLTGPEWSHYRGAADLNGDGKLDLLFEQGSVALGLGNGNFGLHSIPSCRTGGYTGPCDAGAVIGDFNLDGRNDVIVAPYDPASGRFEAVFRMGTAAEPALDGQKLGIPVAVADGLVAGDWNGDKAIDLAVASETSIRIYMNMVQTWVWPGALTPWSEEKVVSPGSLASVFGVNYTTTVASAASAKNPPLSLGGVQLRITDEAGQQTFAPLLYVSPQQINFFVPESVRLGWSTVELVTGTSRRPIASMEVVAVAPSLFYLVTREETTQDGVVAQFAQDFGAVWETPGVFTFYGTGFQGATEDNTRVQFGYSSLPPLSVTQHPDIPGLQLIRLKVLPQDVTSEDGAYGGGLRILTQGVFSNFMYTGLWKF